MSRLKNNLFQVLVSLCLVTIMATSAWANQPASSMFAKAGPTNSGEQTNTDQGAGPDNADGASSRNQVGEKLGRAATSFEASVAALLGDWSRERVFLNIPWAALVFFLGIFAGVFIVERLLRWLIWQRVARRSEQPGVFSFGIFFLQALSGPFAVLFFVYGIYIALFPIYPYLDTAKGAGLFYSSCASGVLLITYIVIIWFFVRLVGLLDMRLRQWAEKTDSTVDNLLVPLVGKTLRVIIVLLGLVLLIQNMSGVKIGPLLASLGIGGIAVALAAKETIANFFGTLTIIFDQPFQTGERIVIEGNDGVVESVGFRSTRIRMLTGHLLTVPNEKVVSSFVENIGKRPHIRWLTNIGITYDTPPAKVEKAVQAIKDVLDNHEGMREDFPPRVFFNNFNDWSLNILVVAWYHPPDYWVFQAWVERTCLEIMRRFNAEGIDFAFPSRTVYMAGDDKRPVNLNIS